MEPINNNNDETLYSKHLVLPIKQITRLQASPMIFQTAIKTKKIDYDDILASMNLFVKDGTLHKINKTDRINMAPSKSNQPIPPTQPLLTQEELQQIQLDRRKALHLNYLQQQRLHAQIKEAKSKRIKFINNTSHLELDSHTTIHAFKLIGK
jgi:hypothetical protein